MSESSPLLKKMIIMMVLLTLASMQPSYATPPVLNTVDLVEIPQLNPATSIRSEKLELLQCQHTVASNDTDVKVSYFNRTLPTKFNSVMVENLTGNWEPYYNNQKSLSCFLIKQSSSESVSMVRFNSRAATLSVRTTITQDTIRAALPAALVNYTMNQIKDGISLSQDCDMIGFFDRLFTVNAAGVITDVIGTSTSALDFKAISQSMRYAIVGHSLYKYVINSTISIIHTFTDNYQNYDIRSHDRRIIVVRWNKTLATNIPMNGSLEDGTSVTGTNISLNVIQQAFSVFYDSTSFSLVHEFSVKAFETNASIESLYYFSSPGLTKIAFRYFAYNNTAGASQNLMRLTIIKSFDYGQLKTLNIKFADQAKFLRGLRGVRNNNDIYVGDYFVVTTNQSLCAGDINLGCHQVCHQFVGDKLVQIGARTLVNGGQVGPPFIKVFVDESITLNAFVLVAFKTVNSTKVIEINYHNHAAVTRIVPTPPPPFHTTAILGPPIWDGPNLESTDSLYDGSTNTTLNSLRFTSVFSTNSSNVINIASSASGDLVSLANNVKCMLYKSGTNNILFDLVANQSSFIQSTITIDTIASEIHNDTIVRLAYNCQRLRLNQTIYYKINATNWGKVNNNYTQFAFTALDENLTYAVVGHTIWKFNAATNLYALYYTNPSGHLANARVMSYDNRFAIITDAPNNTITNVAAFAFLDTSTGLSVAFNYTTWFSSNNYLIEISDSFEMFIIGGIQPAANGSPALKIEIKSLNFVTLTMTNLELPPGALRDNQAPNLILYERFLYVRQIRDLALAVTNPVYGGIPHEEMVFHYDTVNTPKLIFRRQLTNQDRQLWKRTMFKIYPTRILLLQYQQSGPSSITIKSYELSAEIASMNLVGSFVENGKVQKCIIGCTSCTSQTECQYCRQDGYVKNQVTNRCIKCAPGCTLCDENKPTQCTACFNGAYLSGSSCLACSSTCLTCSGTATGCTSCLPGKRYNSVAAACQPCTIRNCITCANDAVCTACKPGFAPVSSGASCRGCASTCSQCDPTSITTCTACNNGLKLINGACVACPTNCISCNLQLSCQVCSDGYYAKQGACILNCQSPCATCYDNQPTACRSCFGTATLIGLTCIYDTSCNTTNTCTSCGESQSSNLYQEGSNCYSCDNVNDIANCVQCNQQNPLICSTCSNGYYLSQGYCLACSMDCLQCTSSIVCMACASGYTLSNGETSGVCSLCESPCLTCKDSPTSCLTCVSGFTKRVWKCQKNNFVDFALIFTTGDAATALSSIDAIVARILTALNQALTKVEIVTFYTVVDGSVNITGSATPTSATSAAGAAALSSGLVAGTTIGGLTLGTTSVTTVSLDSTTTDNKAGVIAGAVIGSIVGVGIIVAVLVYFLYCKKASEAAKVSGTDNPSRIQIQEKNNI